MPERFFETVPAFFFLKIDFKAIKKIKAITVQASVKPRQIERRDDRQKLLRIPFIGRVTGPREAVRPTFHVVFFQIKQRRISTARFQKRTVRPKTAPGRRVFHEKIFVRIVRKIGAMAFRAAF